MEGPQSAAYARKPDAWDREETRRTNRVPWACAKASARRAAGPGGHFESERAAARWLRGHEVGRSAAGSNELLLAPAQPRNPVDAARAESAPGLGVPEVACGGPSPSIPGSPDHLLSPQDRVPEATVLFLADEEKAAGKSRLLLAAGSLAGMLAKGSSLPS